MAINLLGTLDLEGTLPQMSFLILLRKGCSPFDNFVQIRIRYTWVVVFLAKGETKGCVCIIFDGFNMSALSPLCSVLVAE